MQHAFCSGLALVCACKITSQAAADHNTTRKVSATVFHVSPQATPPQVSYPSSNSKRASPGRLPAECTSPAHEVAA